MNGPETKAAPLRSVSVCFVAHNAFGAISGERSGYIGGTERQQAIMARWLSARGHRVSLITWDEGQDDGVSFEGVRVWKTCRRSAGVVGMRFFAPRWTSLRSAMARADAQVYYHNCAEYVTGQVALWANGRRRSFVYSVASDPDCDPRLPTLKTQRERLLYRYGLRHANRVVVQTRRQQKMLAEGFDRSSEVIPMPCIGPSDAVYVSPTPPARGEARVAWVGRVAAVKRVGMLLEVARELKDVRFDIAGPWEQPDAHYAAEATRLRREAESMANVRVLGRLDREALDRFYRDQHALVCSSEYEGFPNTFLEAWSHGVPVVSTIDPDGLIAERALGAVASDAASLVKALRDLLGSPNAWSEASTNARRYFEENHAFEVVMPRFERVFAEATSARRS